MQINLAFKGNAGLSREYRAPSSSPTDIIEWSSACMPHGYSQKLWGQYQVSFWLSRGFCTCHLISNRLFYFCTCKGHMLLHHHYSSCSTTLTPAARGSKARKG